MNKHAENVPVTKEGKTLYCPNGGVGGGGRKGERRGGEIEKIINAVTTFIPNIFYSHLFIYSTVSLAGIYFLTYGILHSP